MKGGGLTLLSGKRKTVFICLYLIRQNIFQKNRLLVYLIVFIGQIFPETGGYGLGLSIAAATADSHKGKIMAETEDEKSLRITVTFPGQ